MVQRFVYVVRIPKLHTSPCSSAQHSIHTFMLCSCVVKLSGLSRRHDGSHHERCVLVWAKSPILDRHIRPQVPHWKLLLTGGPSLRWARRTQDLYSVTSETSWRAHSKQSTASGLATLSFILVAVVVDRCTVEPVHQLPWHDTVMMMMYVVWPTGVTGRPCVAPHTRHPHWLPASVPRNAFQRHSDQRLHRTWPICFNHRHRHGRCGRLVPLCWACRGHEQFWRLVRFP